MRWLDVKVGESEPMRVQLAGSQPVAAELIEDEHASAIEHFIDTLAERILSHNWLHGAGDVAAAPEARDDAGRWHIAAGNGGGFGGGHADVTLRLTPPVHPDATSLEIALIGKSGRAVAKVPLAWQVQP